MKFIEIRTTKCRAGADGDCDWSRCPQSRDNEPETTNRDCPYLSVPNRIFGQRRNPPLWSLALKKVTQ